MGQKRQDIWVSNFLWSKSKLDVQILGQHYNNTVFVNDTLNPEIYFWPDVGDVDVVNNLIFTIKWGNYSNVT